MATSPDLGLTLTFLDELRQNNHKAWFDQHRPDFEAARSAFFAMVDDLIDELRLPLNLQGLTAKDCVPRIYRDIRFSKDKSPYKTNMGAMIAPGGWRSSWLGYYISVEPHGHSIAAGGLYRPTPEQLDRFRQAVDRDAASLQQILSAREFVDAFGRLEGERLKTAPKGYDKAHAQIELLQLKQITAVHHFSDQDVRSPDFAQRVIGVFRAMQPFVDYLNAILR